MSVEAIHINNILVEESRFSLKGFLCESTTLNDSLESSLKHQGILCPLLVFRDGKGKCHLIDGRKRLLYARQNRLDTVNAMVISEAAPVTDIIETILCDKRMELGQSVMNRILFICFAVSLNAPEAWILEFLCVPLGFKPHNEFLKDCERINSLTSEIKLFCHEKKFSLKQILNLAHYPADLLSQLMQWKSVLQLTASIMDELASNLKDCLRAQNKMIRDFVSEPEIQKVIESSLSPRDRTEKLRQLVYRKRFPVLSETNNKIENTVRDLHLPEDISINWDRTLENRNVALTVHVRDAGKMKELIDKLSSTEIKKAMENILEEL